MLLFSLWIMKFSKKQKNKMFRTNRVKVTKLVIWNVKRFLRQLILSCILVSQSVATYYPHKAAPVFVFLRNYSLGRYLLLRVASTVLPLNFSPFVLANCSNAFHWSRATVGTLPHLLPFLALLPLTRPAPPRQTEARFNGFLIWPNGDNFDWRRNFHDFSNIMLHFYMYFVPMPLLIATY